MKIADCGRVNHRGTETRRNCEQRTRNASADWQCLATRRLGYRQNCWIPCGFARGRLFDSGVALSLDGDAAFAERACAGEDDVEDALGDFGLGGFGHVHDFGGGDDGDGVAVGIHADAGLGNVVGNDGVQALATSFLRAFSSTFSVSAAKPTTIWSACARPVRRRCRASAPSQSGHSLAHRRAGNRGASIFCTEVFFGR